MSCPCSQSSSACGCVRAVLWAGDVEQTMFSRNGARSDGYVQELFHEEAQQVWQKPISQIPKFLSPWSLHSWSPLWQGNRTKVTKLPFVLLCKSEVYDLEREGGSCCHRKTAVSLGFQILVPATLEHHCAPSPRVPCLLEK